MSPDEKQSSGCWVGPSVFQLSGPAPLTLVRPIRSFSLPLRSSYNHSLIFSWYLL